MLKTMVLSHLPALDIKDGEKTAYCGGDQEWFAEHWQRQAGCGPTNAANLLWYLAKTRAGAAPLCPYGTEDKAQFIELMQAVWQYVTPGNMGVNSTDIFVTGAKRYADAKGIALSAGVLPVAPRCNGARSYRSVADFVTGALQQDLPVAFLNLSNGSLDNLDSWHWVTIISLRGGDAMICDQGQTRWIDLQNWLSTSVMGGGFVTLEIGQAAGEQGSTV